MKIDSKPLLPSNWDTQKLWFSALVPMAVVGVGLKVLAENLQKNPDTILPVITGCLNYSIYPLGVAGAYVFWKGMNVKTTELNSRNIEKITLPKEEVEKMKIEIANLKLENERLKKNAARSFPQ